LTATCCCPRRLRPPQKSAASPRGVSARRRARPRRCRLGRLRSGSRRPDLPIAATVGEARCARDAAREARWEFIVICAGRRFEGPHSSGSCCAPTARTRSMFVGTRIAALPVWRSTRSAGDRRPRGAFASNGGGNWKSASATRSRPLFSRSREANVTTKKQKARAAAAGKGVPTKPKPKKKTSRGK
jgi:hypothetical protein